MIRKLAEGHRAGRRSIVAVLFCIALTAAAAAQKTQLVPPPCVPSAQDTPETAPPDDSAQKPQNGQPTTHITPDQAKQLFACVDQIMKFSSDDSGLPVKSPVKRQMTTRDAVQSYLMKKLSDDKESKRMERDEIVLKKFGLLDRDFELQPFLIALLKEQIEAYYDTKTKTINLLDWVQPDEQKPVMAHELTHALQDQHTDLDKWDNQTPDDVSTTMSGDQEHVARDEIDSARDAVSEGQATAVMMDYMLKPMGKSLVKDPEVLDFIRQHMDASADSPVMARAPLLISESMLFPYREGLSFEQDVWMDEGQNAAFAGALDRPPTSTWEILNPRDYERKVIPPVPLLPNIHPVVDKLYRPYDIGQVGQLDVQIMTKLFGSEESSRDLTSAWDGGIYWAGQSLSATTAAEQDSTKSLAIFYLSVWHNPASAQAFAQLYSKNLSRKYSSVAPDNTAQNSASNENGSSEEDFTTDEGPVVITSRGNVVFIAESFPLNVARQLTSLILSAQGGGAMRTAQAAPPSWPFAPSADLRIPAEQPTEPLSASFVRFFAGCGVMKTAVDAEMKGAAALH
ncbi:MAG TPA: hypothetical protein VGR47_09365 [Terracidiphilus sp.]|nr:hypothetical protein [Terracidiphilus sp.]